VHAQPVAAADVLPVIDVAAKQIIFENSLVNVNVRAYSLGQSQGEVHWQL